MVTEQNKQLENYLQQSRDMVRLLMSFIWIIFIFNPFPAAAFQSHGTLLKFKEVVMRSCGVWKRLVERGCEVIPWNYVNRSTRALPFRIRREKSFFWSRSEPWLRSFRASARPLRRTKRCRAEWRLLVSKKRSCRWAWRHCGRRNGSWQQIWRTGWRRCVCVSSVKSSWMLTGMSPTWTLLHFQISALQQKTDGGEREAELQQVCGCFFSPF